MHSKYSLIISVAVPKYSLPSFSLIVLKPLSLSLPILASTMAGTADNFGFQRPEMFKSNLSGTVDPYARHLFLCYKTRDSWPSRVEDSDSDPLPKLLSGALKARKNDINLKTRLTVCEGGGGTDLSDGDVLIFPEMIKYRGLKNSEVDSFVEDVLVNGKLWASGMQEVLTGSHVFVCAHNNRDRRCGVCGPVLIEKFREEIEQKGLKDQVFVSACSHVGGHKYAGNLIIFTADSERNVSGHWYGYVVPDDVPQLLDQHIGKGEIIERIWRGQMGTVIEEPEKLDEQKLPIENDLMNIKELVSQESSRDEKESVGSCCEGANGVSCCRGGSLEEKQVKMGRGRLESWFGKWEQHEVLAITGVIAAVATVAIACSLYKRST